MDHRALVVCPEEDSAELLALVEAEMGMTGVYTHSISHGQELLASEHFDVILLDYRAGKSAEEFLAHLHQSADNSESMLIAIVEEEDSARLVFLLGASFVLYRPLTSERTRVSLRAARNLMRRERRRFPRTPLSSSANVAYPGAPELRTVLTDLSEGGTAIHSARPIPSACKVYFEFALPGQPQLVRLSGEVAWQDANGATGIRFLDVPQASRRLIQTWLEKNKVSSPSGMPEPAASNDSPTQWREVSPGENRLVSTEEGAEAEVPENRRNEQRFECKLGAEVYAVGKPVPNHCTVSDISEGGCYVEMPTPISGESGVEILVRTADTKFRIKGEVLTKHPGFGMGVRFTLRDSAEREEIMRLLGTLALESPLKK